jgi:integral membrane protein
MINPAKNPIAFLRNIALIEGISYLILLFVAMPLKYIWAQPQMVKIVGMAHGVLFVIFCASLLHTTLAARWPLGRSALIFLASIVPFGPWIIDRRMKNYESDFFRSGPGSSTSLTSSPQLKVGASQAQPTD